MQDTSTAESESSAFSTDLLRAQFLRDIPYKFRRAARVLQYDEILAAHLRYVHSPLGRSALMRELIPTADREKIAASCAEIDELRLLIGAGEIPSFDGISDIRMILHKVEIEGSTIYIDEGLPLLRTLKSSRLLRGFFATRTNQAPQL